MDYIKTKKDKLSDKYRLWLDSVKGGIFTRKARARLIGLERPFGKNQSKNDFWMNRRYDVQSALVDLTIFFEVAGPQNVHQVVTVETMEPVIKSLLHADEIHLDDQPDPRKALIAQFLIEAGFHFLAHYQPHKITISHKRTIDEALDLSRYLTSEFLGEPEYGELGHYFGEWDRERRET